MAKGCISGVESFYTYFIILGILKINFCIGVPGGVILEKFILSIFHLERDISPYTP